MPENSDTANGGARERRTQRATILAALGGALIGALAGFGGSVLVYTEAKHARQDEAAARRVEDDERRADIRRGAYVDLSASTNKFVTQASELLIISLDPTKTDEDRIRLFDEEYGPANMDLARATTTVRLVTTEAGKRDLDEIGTHYLHAGKLVNDTYAAASLEGIDAQKIHQEFLGAVRQQLAALQKFMDRAASESL
ncbi:hypothetical protein [Streptomyces sp. NBC_01264]|uniref:hypothetical protein n=1 Tax=Streptomyces sp. NBC_01264 TaxID=2903804 RepID=UPI00224F8208|nr:hypothetical protein [Streptomyces sp. NBC_01264]MCX4779989.1 hypothetical protein [Streptomyces sp. NBC_01264]